MPEGEKIIITVDKDLEEIMPMFLTNRNKDIGLLEEAMSSKDFKKIEVIAHKLAGNAGSYGIPDLGDIGSTMESAAGKNEEEAIEGLIQEYKRYLEKLVVEFK